MGLHPLPQLALHPQHDWWNPETAVCSQEEITSTTTRVRAAAVVAKSSRARLRAPSTLVIVFLTGSAHQEGRNVGHLSAGSNVALANQKEGVMNGLGQVST